MKRENDMNESRLDDYDARRGSRRFLQVYSVLYALIAMLCWCTPVLAAQTCLTTIVASTPTADFADNGDGTVTDSETGLMWKRCSEGSVWDGATCAGAAMLYTWQGGLEWVARLNDTNGFAGYADWRVPNVKELNSIMEEQCNYPAVNLEVFPSTGGWYWSSSPYVADVTKAWATHFYNVGFIEVNPKLLPKRIRLVRGQ